MKSCSSQLSRLRKKRKRHQTEAEKLEASTLPTSIVALEKAIQGVTKQLGSPEFRKLKDSTSKYLNFDVFVNQLIADNPIMR